PIPIDDAEIAGIQAAVRSGLPSQPWPFLQVGQRVRIKYGALCDLEGILLDFTRQSRLVLSVTLLQRSVAVTVDAAWVTSTPQKARVLEVRGKSSAYLLSQFIDLVFHIAL